MPLRPLAGPARLIGATILATQLAGCASWPSGWGGQPCRIAAKPTIRRQPVGWHLFDVTVIAPLRRMFEVGRIGRRAIGVPVRSLDLHDDGVADCTFFTNRDIRGLSPDAVRWGPTRPEDLGVPPFTVTKPKLEGKTPGFFVADARGVAYLFKLDPVDAPELLSGAEVVTSKLLHALGYRVPSYEVVFVKPADLRIGPEVMVRGVHGQPRPLTEDDLRRSLEPHLRDGTVRVSASKILEGDILGPARFAQFRDCAEVRALKVVYAWVNDIDAKDHNSLLVWDGTQTVGYLIDFGTSLGADAGFGGPKSPCAGWVNIVDLKETSLEMLTLGLYRPVCDPETSPASPHIGFFSSHVDPDRWKPYAPNLAFHEMNEADARWIARRMDQLTPAQLQAAVEAGQYNNPADAAYLVEALEQRRDTIVRHYLEDELEEAAEKEARAK